MICAREIFVAVISPELNCYAFLSSFYRYKTLALIKCSVNFVIICSFVYACAIFGFFYFRQGRKLINALFLQSNLFLGESATTMNLSKPFNMNLFEKINELQYMIQFMFK